MMIRTGTKEDIPQIVEMGRRFYDESNFEPGGFDDVRFDTTLGYILSGNTHHALIAEHNGSPIGFIIFDCARHYTKYLVAHMFLLYVDKDHRKHGAGPALIREAADFAKKRGCKYFYGSSSAGFDDGGRTDRVLEAIYKRQGFLNSGIFMRKDLQ